MISKKSKWQFFLFLKKENDMLAGVVSVPPEFFFNIPVHWYIYLSCNGAELKEKKELLHGSSPPNFKGEPRNLRLK